MFCLPIAREGAAKRLPARRQTILPDLTRYRGERQDYPQKITVGVKFEVVTCLIEQHLLGVLEVLPHGQFRGVGIFTNQRLEDLVVIVTPVIHRT